ncbi:MAG: RNase adapter RapZ [bacterium]
MHLLVITGLSGSGKTSAIHALEDAGYFCVDNLPILLLPGLVQLLRSAKEPMERLAVVMDVREGGFLREYGRVFRELTEGGIKPEIVFLEAPTEVLLRRFEETCRPHPLAGERTLLDAIEWERRQLAGLRETADRVMDTSSYNIHELRRSLRELYCGTGRPTGQFQVELISFSYAKGIPPQVDMVLDARFLPNPHYDPELKERDGRDAEVRRYVERDAEASKILRKLLEIVEEMMAFYARSDRAYFVLGVGCTGGRHRSVSVVARLEERLKALGYRLTRTDRDL